MIGKGPEVTGDASDGRSIDAILRLAPVIPVLTLDRPEEAAALAELLVECGLPVLEVTLRTPVALDVIRAMQQVKGAVIGAGTVLGKPQLQAGADAGARFFVSPGTTDRLLEGAVELGLPFLPGVSSASDVIRGREAGLTHFKFFPAEASGGMDALKAIAEPFAEARFCPTGGINQANAASWLSLGKVLCVGGSWIVPRGEACDFSMIEEKARAASQLTRPAS